MIERGCFNGFSHVSSRRSYDTDSFLLEKLYVVNSHTLHRTNEILFDAADMRRFGKDVFAQDAHTMNTAGIDWVKRTLSRDGIRVHTLEWEDSDMKFSHLDAKITPVDEDMLLWTMAEAPSQKQLNFFQENDWKTIEVPKRQICASRNDLTGKGIHLNMLTISPSTVIVEGGETNLIKCLREEGVDCIPLKFAPAYRYGGGLNCFTLDVHRDGNMKSYFPTLERDTEDVAVGTQMSMDMDDALPPKKRRVN
jgi:glycine amidinotransferase